MRNGNSLAFSSLHNASFVLILPMRNGNLYKTHTIPQLLFFVLILPMRNGNAQLSREVEKRTNSPYPTYEEWKPSLKPMITG